MRRGDAFAPVKLTVAPVRRTGDPQSLLLVVFEDAPESAPVPLDRRAAAARLVKRLEEELWATKEDLNHTIERSQVTVEDLATANEEVVSVNEELQSANEELESSKEELQSLNEELNTVNQQLQDKIGELEAANSDLRNLLESNEIATLCLDHEFRIKWFSPAARTLFDLVASDVGRPITAFAPKLSDDLMLARRAQGDRQAGARGSRGALGRAAVVHPPHAALPCDRSQRRRDHHHVHRHHRNQAQGRRGDQGALRARRVARAPGRGAGPGAARGAVQTCDHRRARTACDRDGPARRAVPAARRGEPASDCTARGGRCRRARPAAADADRARGKGRPCRAVAHVPDQSARAFRSRADAGAGMAGARTCSAPTASPSTSAKRGDIPRTPLDETVRSVLFRCVRELLANVAKHAKVDAAEVSIFRDGDQLAVSVTDAGVGFDPALLAQPGARGRFGLVSVRERIGFVNGTLAIVANPGDGTIATLTVPLKKPGRARSRGRDDDPRRPGRRSSPGARGLAGGAGEGAATSSSSAKRPTDAPRSSWCATRNPTSSCWTSPCPN